MNTIQDFCALIEKQQHDKNCNNLAILVKVAQEEGRRTYNEYGFSEGKKYNRVWEFSGHQSFAKYFVEKATGKIFGAASWDTPNKKRLYGTLDTIHEWDWSDYYGVSLKGINTLASKQ
jgi:hypothetical protein